MVSFDANHVPIQILQLLLRQFWHIIALRMVQLFISAFPDVDLCEFRRASADAPPLHPLEVGGHGMVALPTTVLLNFTL